jgi:hypothetical protein
VGLGSNSRVGLIDSFFLMLIIINVCIVQYESLVWGVGGVGEAKPGTTWEAPQNGIWAMWEWDVAIGAEVVKPPEVMVPLLQQLG